MYDNLRLTELHEDYGMTAEHARRYEVADRPAEAKGYRAQAAELDAEIRARVERQEIGRWEADNPVLRFGMPDAVRTYR